MRDYQKECDARVAFIRSVLKDAGAQGIVYGNSGGKDSALVGILCKKACDNTLGVIMPCQTRRGFEQDRDDALAVANQYGIETVTVDLSEAKASLCTALSGAALLTAQADVNIAPRLRMTTLYAVAQSRNALVAGTGNRSEGYLGYFTKWGDGAYDLNPIADLTVTEIYEFLEFLNAPDVICTKAPSAGLYDGQTDEQEMGIAYKQVDDYLITGQCDDPQALAKIEAMHKKSEHKRRPARKFGE